MLTAVLFDRAALTLRNLAIAAIVVIVLSPHEVVGPSFQMSFAATAALVGAYAAWSDWRADHPGPPPSNQSHTRRAIRFMLLAAGGLAMTSIVAGGATAIYAAWHFQQMPSLGLFTNLTAMPIVSAVVMPFAVLGALAMPFGLDGPFFHVMGLGLTATIAIARWFSERSPADIVGLVPPISVAVLTVALLIATVSSTWLRAAAVPVALIGLLLLVSRPQPDLFVSEDGRLVGLDVGEGRIAINRSRPNEFTIDNWQRAMRANNIVRPEGKQERKLPEPVALSATARTEPPLLGAGFICAEGICLARHPSGAVVAHALDAQAAIDACASASVIVIDDATAKNVCRWKEVLVVTKRDLALSGSAAINFLPDSSAGTVLGSRPEADDASSGVLASQEGEGGAAKPQRTAATIEYAISRPFRPWHEQRRFSREARGLAPYQRQEKPATPNETSPPLQPAAISPVGTADPTAPEPAQ